jgi:putative SOS response-associated peptidase YedK
MCARYQISVPLEILGQRFGVKVPNRFYQAKTEAFPGQELPVITNAEKEAINFYRWGLVPSWSHDENIGRKLFNARCETLSQKPSFASSFMTRRCLVPADSFIEWKEENGKKMPFKFTLNDNAPFAFAGIYDRWQKGGRKVNSFTIITTEANKLIKDYHDRMPVILKPENEAIWIGDDLAKINSANIFSPFPSNQMKFELLK